ncbi:MAG: SprB repeat-containing protein, partial [Bacteroidota bacterium]
MTLLEACANETVDASALPNGDHTLENNDLLLYALHDNVSNSLGTVFDLSPNPVFGLMPGMTTGTTYYISPIAGPNNGSGAIDMGHLCFGVAQGSPVIFHDIPQAVISGGASICSGETASLTFNFNAGTAPFDVTYTDGASFFDLPDIMDGHTLLVTPSSTTTYSIVSVSDNTDATCQGFGSGIATIEINQVPTANGLNFICNATNTEYQVQFEILGGDAATYTVGGGTGTLDNGIFTSDWIPNGTPYSFVIDDANACGPSTESGNHICDCATATVTMDRDPLLICEDVDAIASFSGVPVLDGNDALGFVLHDSPDITIGTVYATNDQALFSYDPSLTYGQTYYISAVVGDDDGSGFPVLDSNMDPCLAIAPGQPVIFTEIPTGGIQGTASICDGSSTDLVFNLTGTGPFDLTYTDGTTAVDLENINDGHTITVTPTENTTYTLLALSLSNAPSCAGTIDPTTADAVIDLIELPRVENLVVNCNVAGTDYFVTFDISGGDANNYFVDGDPGILTGSSFVSNWKQSGSTYRFEISDGTICAPIIIEDVGLCNCTPDIRPDIRIVENISCPGDADGILAVTNVNGEAPFSFEWNNGATATTQEGLSEGMYFVTMTDDNGCISVDSLFLTDPDSIRADIITTPVTCYGENDGTLTILNVTGGAGDYEYELDANVSYIDNEFLRMTAGTYRATITDALGCSWEQEATVETPDEIIVDLGETKIINYGDSIQLEASFNQAID